MSIKPSSLVIVYHSPCIDGAACAWCITKVYEQDKIPAVFIPYDHANKETAEKEIELKLSQGAALYFVDVAPDISFLNKVLTLNEAKAPLSVSILDHHKSAGDLYKDYKAPSSATVKKLDIDIQPDKRSAARMVWAKVLPSSPVPPVLDIIDMMDGDAAGLKTPEDFAAAALIDSFDIRSTESAFKNLQGLAGLTFNEMAKKGDRILQSQTFNLSKLLDQAMYIDLPLSEGAKPERVLILNGNVQYFGRRISEQLVDVAHSGGARVAMSWFMQKNGRISISLRSNGDPDLSKAIPYLNGKLGCTGGGHEAAGALHFSSLFEFARAIPLSTGRNIPPPPPPPPETPSIH